MTIYDDYNYIGVQIAPTQHWNGETNGRAIFERYNGDVSNVKIYVQGMGVGTSRYRFTPVQFYCKLRDDQGKLKRYILPNKWTIYREPFDQVYKSGRTEDEIFNDGELISILEDEIKAIKGEMDTLKEDIGGLKNKLALKKSELDLWKTEWRSKTEELRRLRRIV